MQRTRPVKILRGGRSIAHRYRDGIVEVFREAFAGPPYFEGPEEAGRFSDRLVAHAEYRGFRICLALDPGQRRVVGFAYGCTVPPDSWWWESLAAYLSPNLVRGWLEDAFEIVQLAVLPAEQGRGIGSALHDGLLEGVAHRRAVLSTLAGDTPARRLYDRRGWVLLAANVRFPGADRPHVLMGKDLGHPVGQGARPVQPAGPTREKRV
jgi:ribosomal protein S18 acetylase RimI-like enzyme